MIQRINLIEKEPFKFSYQRLIHGIAAVIFLCVLLYGSQILRQVLGKAKIRQIQEELAGLKARQEQLMKKAEPEWKGSAAAAQLKGIFSSAIVWSDVLRDVTGRLPPSVWLTGFKTGGMGNGKEEAKEGKKEGKKEAKKEAPKKGPSLKLAGKAKNASELSQFVSRLTESPYVSKAVLRDSKIDNGDFTFDIECDIITGK